MRSSRRWGCGLASRGGGRCRRASSAGGRPASSPSATGGATGGWARGGGSPRVNLDPIYGLPQTGAVGPQQPFDGAQDRPMERWQASLERAIALRPDHMSLYALTEEEGTKLGYDIEHGSVPEPAADAQPPLR